MLYTHTRIRPGKWDPQNDPLIMARKPDLVIEIYEALCFDVAQGQKNLAPNETRTDSCSFASLTCKPLHHQRCSIRPR